MIYTTGSDTYAVAQFTSFARSLVDDSSASAARSTLELGSSDDVEFSTIDSRVAVSSTTTGTIDSTWLNRSVFATGTITLATSVGTTGDMIGPIVGNGGARTISRGTMTNMFVNGSNVSSCTLDARGACTVIFSSASTCYVIGDVS